MIPSDHPVYIFPYNLEDRVKYIIKKIKKIIMESIDYKTKKINDGVFNNKRSTNLVSYQVFFPHKNIFNKYKTELTKLGGILTNDKQWDFLIE